MRNVSIPLVKEASQIEDVANIKPSRKPGKNIILIDI